MSEFPLVSFCLFTYNQEDYIAEAIDGALSQDYANLEIIISDDCSTDNTWAIIEEKCSNYTGQHKLILNRNKTNLGLAAHTNKLYYQLSKGKYIAIAAGDDVSLPKRISKSVDFLEINKDVVALSTSLIVIDDKSELHENQKNSIDENKIYNIDYYLSKKYQHINGPSRIVTRELINAYPPLNDECPTEDITMLLRAFIYGKVALLEDKLVKYRIHGSNISSPEGLRKMKLEYIFEQNYADISYSIVKYIDEKRYKQLIDKINHLKNRRLGVQVIESKKSIQRRAVRKIIKKLLGSKISNIWYNKKRSFKDIIFQYRNAHSKSKYIKLGGSTGSSNYGDALNVHLMKSLVGYNFYESYLFQNEQPELLMIGSVLHRLHENTIVWGAGLIKKDIKINVKPKKIYAVRGPLTRSELLKNNIECPEVYGDPALLLPMIYMPKAVRKKYKYGIIPHYMDKYHPSVREMAKRKDTLFIDIEKDYNNWTDLIDLILSCENVLSSSLHGVIISDIYEVPNLWFNATDGVTGDGFKFRDYFMSVNRLNNKPFDITEDLSNLDSELSKWRKIHFDNKKLIKAFPMPNLLNPNARLNQ